MNPSRGFAAAGILGALLFAACRGDADFSDAAPKPVTLDADGFRADITEIDRQVFRPGPFDPARREDRQPV